MQVAGITNETKGPSTIFSSLEDLRKMLNILGENIRALDEKMSPILRPLLPIAPANKTIPMGPERAGDVPSIQPQLVEEIMGIREQVCKINTAALRISDRLAL